MRSGWLLVLLAYVLGPSQCQAGGDDIAIVAFGDSLTDTHKSYGMSTLPSPDLYYQGSFTNAPGCWADQLSTYAKGVQVENYAYGGATACKYFDLILNNTSSNTTSNTTNSTTVPCLGDQITEYYQNMTNSSTYSSADKVSWYAKGHKHQQPAAYITNRIPVIWIGHQDLEIMLSLPLEQAEQVPSHIVECILNGTSSLLAKGHATVIVATLAPMGYSPMAADANVTQELSGIIEVINKQIKKGVRALQYQHKDRHVLLWDVNPVMTYVMTHKQRYGFKYSTPRSCLVGADALAGVSPTSVCEKPNEYFWYDSQNPSARAHQAILNSLLYILVSKGYTRPMNPGRFAYWTRH